jgi:hypothetical protein
LSIPGRLNVTSLTACAIWRLLFPLDVSHCMTYPTNSRLELQKVSSSVRTSIGQRASATSLHYPSSSTASSNPTPRRSSPLLYTPRPTPVYAEVNLLQPSTSARAGIVAIRSCLCDFPNICHTGAPRYLQCLAEAGVVSPTAAASSYNSRRSQLFQGPRLHETPPPSPCNEPTLAFGTWLAATMTSSVPQQCSCADCGEATV